MCTSILNALFLTFGACSRPVCSDTCSTVLTHTHYRSCSTMRRQSYCFFMRLSYVWHIYFMILIVNTVALDRKLCYLSYCARTQTPFKSLVYAHKHGFFMCVRAHSLTCININSYFQTFSLFYCMQLTETSYLCSVKRKEQESSSKNDMKTEYIG